MQATMLFRVEGLPGTPQVLLNGLYVAPSCAYFGCIEGTRSKVSVLGASGFLAQALYP